MFSRFQDYAEELKPTLDAAFVEHLARLLGETRPLHAYGEADLLTGGKKIRGTLLCLVAAALGGSLDGALPRAIAVELIHTATLIHDDFVDQHQSRRNAAAIWTLEGARRAVLLGDLVFASAIQSMSELGRDDGRIVSRAIAEVSRGAYREPLNPAALLTELEAERMDASLYEKIIYLKTGVLFGAACQLGAVAAGMDGGRQQAWRRYGEKIGEAYQIADDLHDVEQGLRTGSVTASELAPLAPAFLYFAGEARPHLLEALRHDSPVLGAEFLGHFRTAAAAMEGEVECRLEAAAAEIRGDSPDNHLSRLACQAPWDLIQMFDGARSPLSVP